LLCFAGFEHPGFELVDFVGLMVEPATLSTGMFDADRMSDYCTRLVSVSERDVIMRTISLNFIALTGNRL